MNDHSTFRLKPFLEFYSNNGKIYFFRNPGNAFELDDHSGFIAYVCKLMDGKLNVANMKKKLSAIYPEEVKYLKNLIQVLDDALLLEDASHNQPDGLTDYDISRWQRNIEFFGAYSKAAMNKFAPQTKLQSIKVTLLGLGGAGTHLLYDLAALGVLQIQAVDFDNIELSNLNRQILYNESDIGKLKTEVARKRIEQFLPQANMNFINKKISSSKDIESIIDGQDIIISVMDKPRDKIVDWVNLASVNKNIPFICGAFDWKWALCYSVWPGKTGCIACWKIGAKKTMPLFQELIQKNGFNSADSLNVAIVPFVAMLSGLILTEFLKMITGVAKPRSLGSLLAFDFESCQILPIESWQRESQCNVCQSL